MSATGHSRTNAVNSHETRGRIGSRFQRGLVFLAIERPPHHLHAFCIAVAHAQVVVLPGKGGVADAYREQRLATTVAGFA
jgi:hypothetical protein